MKSIISSVLFVLLFLRPSREQCLSENDSYSNSTVLYSRLYHVLQEFSFNLLETVNLLKPSENIFISPYSTYQALVITYFLSKGRTENSLKAVLRVNPSQTKSNFYQVYKLHKLMTRLGYLNNSFEFTNANKIYIADQINTRACISTLFSDELSTVPFQKDPEGARISINNWVQQYTRNMIKELLPPGTIDQSTTLALINAAYFKAKWESKFDPRETKVEVFYVSLSKRTFVPMMQVTGVFEHQISKGIGAHVLELPYEGSRISMFVLLPPFVQENGIDQVLKKLTVNELKNIVEGGAFTEKVVKVSFPKFSMEQTVELVPILESMGLDDLFKPTSNFSTLSRDKVTLGHAIHKARIEVDERGTKVAASEVLFDFKSYRPSEPAVFICNHPFIFLLYDRIQNVILFMGVFRKPE